MSSYEALAARYDALTEDVDYAALCDYLELQFKRSGRGVHTVLDLACGTGTLTCLMAQRGYEMIGADQSGEMLAVAADKGRDLAENAPIFLQQTMQALDLYGTVDACVCCLDSVNYVTRPALLRRAFQRVRLFLEPGGIFIFDVNTVEKLRSLDGGTFIDETDDTYCVWRADYAPRRRICTYGIDLFTRKENGDWTRACEEHEERAYERSELEIYLQEAGFCDVKQFGERKLRGPKAGEQRVFFTARKEL